MADIYGGFKLGEETYSYGSNLEDFEVVRATISVDNVDEAIDFMNNTFGKPIPIAPGYSWQYEDAMTHDSRERLKNLVGGKVKEVKAVEKEVVEVVEKTVLCSCGHEVPASLVMYSSSGTTCPDCYDRMSE